MWQEGPVGLVVTLRQVTALTRREQREQTRERLLDGAMMALVEHGYAGTTTQRVQERVGVSRGALLHHFSSKAELFAAAVHHIADMRIENIRAVAQRVGDGPNSLRQIVFAMHDSMTGPAFLAAMELWTASRTDDELREALLPAERRLGRALREVFDRAARIDDPETARTELESLLALLRGLELGRIMRQDDAVAVAVIEQWLDRFERDYQ
ncbi:TetR/AcrR family transcriptional regulator [Saccharopolyspora mangrovi]|uniref:TetR/AcrR family transcriptional regulator n=1 Tax=Saccharopolyspora mangrovi TaxID=3082379 RepID=A0ABU6AJT3_9PSEU|nr:TetR/AcrR family transcriptional regulator [Saccharopolyspora sp. S2-29]MEB3371763.1 TetR/AcrR family transcriptional regulator [Saccharopolyspora sp. S2-29]